MSGLILDVIYKLNGFNLSIVGFGHGGIWLEGLICIISLVNVEAWWPAVVISKHIDQKLMLLSEMRGERPPQEVHGR